MNVAKGNTLRMRIEVTTTAMMPPMMATRNNSGPTSRRLAASTPPRMHAPMSASTEKMTLRRAAFTFSQASALNGIVPAADLRRIMKKMRYSSGAIAKMAIHFGMNWNCTFSNVT